MYWLMFHLHFKNAYSAFGGGRGLKISTGFDYILLVECVIKLFDILADFLSINSVTERGLLKSPNIIVDFFYFFSSDSFCLVYAKALLFISP